MRDVANARRLQKKWREAIKRDGRCRDCPAQAEPGKVRCGPCREAHNENNLKANRLAGKPKRRPRGPYKTGKKREEPQERVATIELMLALAERTRRLHVSL